jgi:uncharacterized protein
MRLNNDFRVGVTPTQAWKVLTDLERIAPLWPGAHLQEIDGDQARGGFKVKVGSISAHYKGTVTFVERDELAGRMVIKAVGRSPRNQSDAEALLTVTVTPDGDGTLVSVSSDLSITGKLGEAGTEVLAGLGNRLFAEFADALESDLSSETDAAGGAGESVADADSAAVVGAEAGADIPTDAEEPPADPSTDAAPTVEEDEVHEAPPVEGAEDAAPAAGADTVETDESDDAEAEPVVSEASAAKHGHANVPESQPADVLDAAGGSATKKFLPAGSVALGLLLLVALRRRRRRRGRRRIASALALLPSVPALPSLPARASLPARHSLPALPALPSVPDRATVAKVGRRAAKRARKAARR